MLTTFRETFRRHALLRAIVFILLGVAIAINPDAVFDFIAYLIAGYLILLGIINIFENYRLKKKTGVYGLGLAGGIIQIILAIFVLFLAPTIVSILPFLLGLSIVLNGIFQLVVALNSGQAGWLVYSALLIIVGAVLVFNPFQTLLVLFQVFGVIVVIMGISEAVSHFQSR